MFFIHPNLTILGRIAALARYGLLTDVLTTARLRLRLLTQLDHLRMDVKIFSVF